SALKAKLAGCMSGGARRRSMDGLFREIDAGDQPVAECVDGDDLEFLAAGRAHHFLMVHHGVTDGNAVLEISLVLWELREGLGIAGADRLAAGFGRLAVQAGDDAILSKEGRIGVQVLGVIGLKLLLGDIDIGIGRMIQGSSHRSTSPNTMSSEPSTAETSASIWPLHM